MMTIELQPKFFSASFPDWFRDIIRFPQPY